jgi:hydrogenase maturation protease
MSPLLIGIGHPYRRDDGVGPAVVEAIAAEGFEALIHHGEGTDLMERWQGRGVVVVVDATASGAAAGTIRRWDAVAAPLPAGLFPKGSHQFGLAEGIEMARLLGRLPAALTVIGVEGADFGAGQGLSPAVAAALPQAVAEVLAALTTL